MLQAKKSYSANWNIEGKRFLEPAELRRLKRISERLRDKALKDNRKTPVKDWFLITTAIETGLRVQELTDLCCGDIYAIHGHGYVFVRNGKGGKSRPVAVRKEFIEKADEFMSWKQSQGEKTEKDDPLFSSKGRRMSKMALQKSYKRSVTKAGIFQKTGVGIHSLMAKKAIKDKCQLDIQSHVYDFKDTLLQWVDADSQNIFIWAKKNTLQNDLLTAWVNLIEKLNLSKDERKSRADRILSAIEKDIPSETNNYELVSETDWIKKSQHIDLYHTELLQLLNRKDITIQEIHQYLVYTPILLPLRWPVQNKVFSNLKLGKKFVVDFAFARNITLGCQWYFIKLGHPHSFFFDQDDDPSKELMHEIKILKDWERWFEKNVQLPNVGLPFKRKDSRIVHVPRLILIYGRRKSLSNADINRLNKLEIRFTDIMTYDRLVSESGRACIPQLAINACSFDRRGIKVLGSVSPSKT
mgnify:CR=1 FL=1